MARQLYLRIVSAFGLVALAALFVGIDPFLSAGLHVKRVEFAVITADVKHPTGYSRRRNYLAVRVERPAHAMKLRQQERSYGHER